MKAIAINGVTLSGKTTVCETIIRGLRRRGHSVGSVKEIHFEGFAIDPDPATNTNRHRAAGAALVTARGWQETDVLYPEKLPILDILRHYDHNFVILEGVTDCNAPRILTAHTEQEVLERLDDRVIAISGMIANSGVRELAGLPVIHALREAERLVDLVIARAFAPLPDVDAACCSACGYTCRALAGRIARQQAKRDDCRLLRQQTELRIDGRPVTMVPFVQQILRNAVLGVAGALDGYREGAAVEVLLHPWGGKEDS